MFPYASFFISLNPLKTTASLQDKRSGLCIGNHQASQRKAMKKIFLIPLVSLFLFACEKKDDHIILYTSQPTKDVTVLIDAFQKQNPDIKVEVFRSGTVEVLDKISKEAETSQVQADVVMISDSIAM